MSNSVGSFKKLKSSSLTGQMPVASFETGAGNYFGHSVCLGTRHFRILILNEPLSIFTHFHFEMFLNELFPRSHF